MQADVNEQKKKEEQKKASRRTAQAKYNGENTTFIGLRFNNRSDWDVIAKLKAVPSKLAYIRQLIRDDIVRTGFNPGPKPTKPGAAPDPSTLPPVEPVPTVTPEEIEAREKEEALRMLGL